MGRQGGLPCYGSHIGSQMFRLVSSSKSPAHVTSSIPHVCAHTASATPLFIRQCLQHHWNNYTHNRNADMRPHPSPSGSLWGKSKPRLPNSASAKQPPCHAASSSLELCGGRSHRREGVWFYTHMNSCSKDCTTSSANCIGSLPVTFPTLHTAHPSHTHP